MVIRHVEMKISKETKKGSLKKPSKLILDQLENSAIFAFLEEFFTSERPRIVKKHFQHTLKVSEVLS